jgi:hypothetical protein
MISAVPALQTSSFNPSQPFLHPKPAAVAKMSESSLPLKIGETIQTASINRSSSPAYNVNISPGPRATTSDSSPGKYEYDRIDGVEEEEEEEDIPYSVIRPMPRRASFPPLPDLRFEQSYLASIASADTKWKIAYITIRDQV